MVVPSMKGFHKQIRSELSGITAKVPVELDTSTVKSQVAAIGLGDKAINVKADAETAVARGKVKQLGDEADKVSGKTRRIKFDVDSKSMVDGTNAVGAFARNLTTLAVPVLGALAIPAITSLAGVTAQASGSLLLLPAAGAAGATVLTTMALATHGLGDAFKYALDPSASPEKLAEAMAKLSPNARAFVTDIRAIKPAFDTMRMDVQNAAFANMGTTVSQLSGTYLPVLRTGLTGVATEMNLGAQGVARFAQEGQTVRDVQGIFAGTATVVRILNPALVDVLAILRDITAEGMNYLPGVASGFAGATGRAREFIAAARESGQLGNWIESGIRALSQLGAIAANVGGLLVNVYRASGSDATAFLQNLIDITARWQAWAASAEGSTQIAETFRVLRAVGAALLPIVGAVAGILVDMLGHIGPLIPPAADAFDGLLASAKPVFDIFWWAVSVVLPPIIGLLGMLAPVLGPIAAIGLLAGGVLKFIVALKSLQFILVGARIAWAALNLVMALSPFGIAVVAISALVAALIYAWNNSETFRNVVTAAWEAVKNAVGVAWAFIRDNVLAPMGSAVIAVGKFFVDLWQNWVVPAWEGIKSAVSVAGQVLSAVWDGIVTAAKIAFVIIATIVLTPLMLLWNEVSGLFMWGYENLIKPAWEGITGAIQTAWGIISPIFNFIVSWLSDQLTSATNGFRDACIAAWEAIKAGINIAWIFIRDNIWQPILDFINARMMPGFNIMKDAIILAWNLIRDGINAAWQFILNTIWNPMLAFINGVLIPGFNILRDGVILAWNTLRDAINAGWIFIRDNIWNPLVEFITVTIPEGFRSGVAIIQQVWDGIKRALRDPLQAAIDVVWNDGIVKVWNNIAELVNLSTRLSPVTLAGFAAGGAVRGGIPGKDSVHILAQQGEYVWSKPAVDAIGGTSVIDMLHRRFAEGGSPRRRANEWLPGYQAGGPVVANPFALAGDIWGAITSGVSALAGAVSGAGTWGEILVGFGKRMADEVLNFLKAKVAEFLASFVGIGAGGMGGGVVAGNVGAMMAALRAAFPGLALISGFRPGAITATGNASYHGMGRAVDLPPSMAVFNWIRANFGAQTKELIFTPAGGAQIHNGSPHVYTGVTAAMHYDHVHWAMDQGGMLNGKGIFAKNTARPERVLSPRQNVLFERMIDALDGRARGYSTDDRAFDAVTGGQGAAPLVGTLVAQVPPGATAHEVVDVALFKLRHTRRGLHA